MPSYSIEHCEEQLAKVDADLAALEDRPRFDHGMLNIPLSKRVDINAQLDKYKKLMERRKYWANRLSIEKARLAAPVRQAEKERDAAAYRALDLRALLEGKTEVLWSFMTDKWLPIVKINKKTVRVKGASDFLIPADQIYRAR
ncbi:hypothetical protein [Gulosibacter molinativorax]|uniref:Uncharacterized protein n=1 Tax=Gulosibacter molinativorax TaxID=256821 RepID=A0ABT7C9F0_9MICO|nr:hypothetical protein [Gulosibacter molinativorax]MDJ1371777.1 hypothetical protein [Gulosibacter molinativorax]QUY60853.1 Hypotetical protein [Gulosibacter molinativorax]